MLRLLAAGMAIAISIGPIVAARGADPPTAARRPAATQPSARVLSADEVARQLSGNDWRERRRVMDELVRLGPETQPLLEEVIRLSQSEEARKNAEAASQLIADERALAPSLITLHVARASPRQVFDEIARQCGAAIHSTPPRLWDEAGWPALTLDIDRQPFWVVMRDVGERLDVHCLPDDSHGVRVMRGAWTPDGITTSGPFLVAADVINTRRRLMVGVSLYGEPKITIVRIERLRFDGAIDNNGNRLMPLTPRPLNFGLRPWGGIGSTTGWRVYATLQHPAGEGDKIASFKGSVTVAVQTRSENWEVPDPVGMPAVTRLVDGIPVTLASFGPKTASEEYQLQVRIPDGWANRLTMGQIMESLRTRLQVFDDSGNPLTLRDISEHGLGSGISFELDFIPDARPDGTPPGKPERLDWEVPTETRQLTIPFEFRDLPIADPFR